MSARFQEAETARLMAQVDRLRQEGELAACIEALRELADPSAPCQPERLQEIAQRFTSLGLHVEAERCFARALALEPENPAHLYNHATALIALGRLAEAERALDRVIELAPGDSDAWYNRATLRRQTAQGNHVALIEEQLRRLPASAPGEVALSYALAKELEDLGEHARSFAALKRGADARRRRLAYAIESDVETMRLIGEAFSSDFFARPHRGHDDARPLFVVGLPRSGSTLVDRILSSHPGIGSRGESTDLALALLRTAAPSANKAELVRHSTQLDFRALGERYCKHLSDGPALRLIDKTPTNFLYLGLIIAALPQARVVHVRRRPMDACYAMYKTLFRSAYPFSYDLQDLGRYWLAYDRLMEHWRGLLPADRFLEVDYEDLVANQEAVSRRLVAHAGLPWDAACLAFENNNEPTLTASAAQVRQPIYKSSVELWRRYETQLSPLVALLRQAGIAIDETTAGDA